MAKNVFRPTEIVSLMNKVIVQAPAPKVLEKPEESQRIQSAEIKEEMYSGPSIEDLRREADEFRESFGKEREDMIAAARAEAEQIIREAEEQAFEEMRKKTDEAELLRRNAADEADRLLSEARKTASEMQTDILKRTEEADRQAYQEGFTRGREDGFGEGRAEVDRLVDRLHVVLDKAIEKRTDLILESETQLVNLVLLIARKVIKVISENQKSVIINNAVQALRKVKTRTDIIIRVNTADLKITSQHVKDFIKLVETAKNITVMEDTSVDQGGCIIETDFGLVDARIASQLNEIEEKILELMPIRSSIKTTNRVEKSGALS